MVGPVRLILSHLLDNAARYSPPQTYVEVSTQLGHHGVTLLIDDAGKRMSDEELERARQTLEAAARSTSWPWRLTRRSASP